MALNRVILFGRLTKDVDLRRTQAGVAVARFTVACDRQYANKQTGERETDFIECVAWRNTADFVARYFSKGNAITVEGTLQNNIYEDKNKVKHYSYVVIAEQVGFAGSKQDSQDQQPIEKLNVDEFEEIISDGETPF